MSFVELLENFSPSLTNKKKYNLGQNSLEKPILLSYFLSYSYLSTIFNSFVPPPISMLLFSGKSLRKNTCIGANNIDIGEGE